jgi:hypothetical protein
MTVRRGLWVGVWSLILPSTLTALLIFAVLLVDVLPETDRELVAVTVGAGVLAGAIGGLGFGVRGWWLLVPPLATGAMGLAAQLSAQTDAVLLAIALVWLGQSIVMYLSIWLSLTQGVVGPSGTATAAHGDEGGRPPARRGLIPAVIAGVLLLAAWLVFFWVFLGPGSIGD